MIALLQCEISDIFSIFMLQLHQLSLGVQLIALGYLLL